MGFVCEKLGGEAVVIGCLLSEQPFDLGLPRDPAEPLVGWAGARDQDVLLLPDRQGYDPIYRNNGDGTFTRTIKPSLQEVLDREVNEFNVFCGWVDYHNDGDLDLFVPDWSEHEQPPAAGH